MTNCPEWLLNQLKRADAYLRQRGHDVYVVGGVLRDERLSRPCARWNIDLAVARGALQLGRDLARHLDAAFVPLDPEHGSARLVLRAPLHFAAVAAADRAELDLNDFRGPTLQDDLRLRDFTINAMAMPLDAWLAQPARPGALIDPLDGVGALASRQLIPCHPGAFRDDPLRILRGFRFVAQLGCSLSEGAARLMAESVDGLRAVSGERIRDELLALLATDRAFEAVQGLERIGALDRLLPELTAGRGLEQGDFHHLDVLNHQLEALRLADRLLADFAEFTPALREVLPGYCAESLVEGRTRKALIKLGTLLHDIGKPTNRQVHDSGDIWFIGHEHGGAELIEPLAGRLCLSNREAQMLWLLVKHHLRPGFLSREPELTRRALYRFYKDLGEFGPACLLLWWCDRMATRGPKSRVDQIDEQRQRLEEMLGPFFFKPEEVVRPPRLVDGHALMQAFGLRPGPAIGRALAAIEEAQAEGRVASREQAMAVAREILTQPPPAAP